MSPKDPDGMANSADPDQTAPSLFAQTCLSENLRKANVTQHQKLRASYCAGLDQDKALKKYLCFQ